VPQQTTPPPHKNNNKQQQQLPPRNSFFPRRKTTTALGSQFLDNSGKPTRWIPAPECKRDYTSSNRMAWQMDSENAAKPRCSKESTGRAGKAIAKGGNAEQN
jgi:hypothetical protein